MFVLSLLLGGLVPATAQGTEVEDLFEAAKPIIAANVLPKEPVTVTAARNAQKQTPAQTAQNKGRRNSEAELRSIEGLLARYNAGLSQKRARSYAEYIVDAAKQFKQDPFVLTAMIVNESSARHDALSKGGDYGLMQVRWRVHKKNITKKYPHIKQAKDMFDPKYNVLVGTEIFSRYRAASNDLHGGLLRYSAGNKKLARKIFAEMKKLEDSYQKHLKAQS